MKSIVRLRIANKRVFMGKGVRELLESIDKEQSIKKATEETGISYPKAMRMLRIFREEIGFPAVVSEKGGNHFGGTKLTKEGREVLECYTEIEQQVSDYAAKLVKEKFNF